MPTRSSRRNCGLSALLTSALWAFSSANANAQTAAAPEEPERVSGYAEVVVVDRYVYHGLVLEDQGAIVQPYVLVSAAVYAGNGFLNSAAVTFSFFSSLQSHNSSVEAEWVPSWWYELQLEPGIELTFGRHYKLSAVYRYFDSPSGAFDSAQEAELTLAFDDSHLLGNLAVHPHVTWTRSLRGESGIGEKKGNSYFEVGIAPSWEIGKSSRLPVNVTGPVTLGVGDNHYYGGDRFGFVSAGLSVAIPLAFVPAGWGTWNFSVSGTYYHLGRNAAEETNGGNQNASVFAMTLSTDF